MKPLLSLLCLLMLSLASPSLNAQAGPPPWAGGQGGPAKAGRPQGAPELGSLEHFLTLSDEQLDAMLKAIQRVRAMNPKEREALRKQIAEYRQLPPEEKAKIRAGWGWNDETDRRDWPVMMRGKTEAERTSIQAELQALPQEQRSSWKHTLLEEWRKTAPRARQDGQ